MSHDFILDLKCARRKSGLTQADCGHLLGGSTSKISQLELGKRLPTLIDICTLSLIFGRNFESLFSALFEDVRADLSERLGTLPEPEHELVSSFNRKNTLDALAERLLEETGPNYGC